MTNPEILTTIINAWYAGLLILAIAILVLLLNKKKDD